MYMYSNVVGTSASSIALKRRHFLYFPINNLESVSSTGIRLFKFNHPRLEIK